MDAEYSCDFQPYIISIWNVLSKQKLEMQHDVQIVGMIL